MRLANSLIRSNLVPCKFIADAFYISIATIHGMDYLLAWKGKHIANATIRYKIEKVCHENGYINPIICTPEELPEE